MAISDSVFADSNYFVSLFNSADSRHAHAQKVSQQIETEKVHLIVSNYVFSEVVTVLAQRRSKRVAVEVGNFLLFHTNVSFVHIDEDIQHRTWDIFQDIAWKNIGFVDCSTIAAMQAEKVSTLLTFDKTDFKKLQNQYKFSFYE